MCNYWTKHSPGYLDIKSEDTEPNPLLTSAFIIDIDSTSARWIEWSYHSTDGKRTSKLSWRRTERFQSRTKHVKAWLKISKFMKKYLNSRWISRAIVLHLKRVAAVNVNSMHGVKSPQGRFVLSVRVERTTTYTSWRHYHLFLLNSNHSYRYS